MNRLRLHLLCHLILLFLLLAQGLRSLKSVRLHQYVIRLSALEVSSIGSDSIVRYSSVLILHSIGIAVECLLFLLCLGFFIRAMSITLSQVYVLSLR